MRDKKEVEEQMRSLGFSIWGYSKKGSEPSSIIGIHYNGINLEVALSEGEDFTYNYIVPRTVAIVTLGPCGPFKKEEHAKNMYNKMADIVQKLNS